MYVLPVQLRLFQGAFWKALQQYLYTLTCIEYNENFPDYKERSI
jgi:hypothetical protein